MMSAGDLEKTDIRVLVVEDNPGDALFVLECMKTEMRSHLTAHVCETLGEGIEEFKRAPYDIVLLDLGLPDSLGIETFESMREAAGDIPIVVLSGQVEDGTVLACIERGACDCLCKGRADQAVASLVYNIVTRSRALFNMNTAYANTERLIADSPDPMIVLDDAHCLKYANRAASDFFGRRLAPGDEFGFPLDSDSVAAELEVRRPGGKISVAEMRSTATQWYDEPAKLVTLRDVTDRKNAKLQKERLTRRLQIVTDVNQLIAHEKETEILVRKVCDLIESKTKMTAWVALRNSKGTLSDRPDESHPVITPLRYGDKTFGVLGVSAPLGKTVNDDDKLLLEEIARDLALAIDGIEKEQLRDQAVRETAALLEANRAVLASTSFEQAARKIFEICKQQTGATSGYVALRHGEDENKVLFLDAGGSQCTVDPSLPMPIRGLWAKAYEENRTVYENDFATSKYIECMPKGRTPLQNVMFAPIALDGTVKGIIGLANKEAGFDDEDANRAQALGECAAIALERASNLISLAEREELLSFITDNMFDMVSLADREWRFTYASPSHRQLGYEPQDLHGHLVFDFVHKDDSDYIMKQLAHAVENPQLPRKAEYRFRRADGTYAWLETVGRIFKNDHDELEKMIFSTREITERKNMQAQLAQADRLSSMGMLAAGVAHEINNPLSYILYNLDTLSSDIPKLFKGIHNCLVRLNERFGFEVVDGALGSLSDKINQVALNDYQNRLRDALDGTRRIRDIARGLGTFSRVERDNLSPVSLTPVIEAALNMCFNEIKYRARLVKDYGKVPTVLASEGRLSQVFLNLFVNAAHAIGEGDLENNEIRVRTWAEGETVCAEVRDTGGGVAPENIGKLFEPFYTTKDVGVGSGLGLPISKDIIEGYGGTITVESEPGRGTVFSIRLPVRSQELAEQPEEATTKNEKQVRGRVLIIDDEAGIRAAMVRMLRGHETAEADSGESARKILERDANFDLILCDIMMPKITGMELHAWLEAVNPELARRVIFVTGGAFTPKTREYLAKIDNFRLEKPLDAKNFKKIADEFIWRAKHEASKRDNRADA